MTVIEKNTPAAWDERAALAQPWQAGVYKSEYGQTQRFLAVLRHLELRVPCSLLDFGCGTGRLASFLPDTVTYYAYDWSALMRDRVHADVPRAIVFNEVDPDIHFDHVVAVGPFNLADNWTHEQTRRMIRRLWTQTQSTLAVSLLRFPTGSRTASTDTTTLRYDPTAITGLASMLGATRFTVDCSYLDNDLLMVCHR